jgi:hypothetical protein
MSIIPGIPRRSSIQVMGGSKGGGGGGGGGGGAHLARAPLKLEKIRFFGVNRDFSDEIPKQFSGLPPQLETIRFFGVK